MQGTTLSPTSICVLQVLARYLPRVLTVRELIHLLGEMMTERSMYRALKELETHDLIERVVCLSDTRQKEIYVTKKGRKLIKKYRIHQREIRPPRRGRPHKKVNLT